MKLLVACEESGTLTNALRQLKHEAYSCDILPTRGNPEWHLQCDVALVLNDKWDAMFAFPPCTRLCVSGARWFSLFQKEQDAAVTFFMSLVNANIPKIAIENPIGVMSTKYRIPDQIIQPWQFGHGETKSTCLWLKGLPKLKGTNMVEGRLPRIHQMSPGPNRSRDRSVLLPGIALAMADQWTV